MQNSLDLVLLGSILFIIRKSILGVSTDRLAFEVENVWD